MRNRILLYVGMLLLCVDAGAQEPADWSWRGGFFGDPIRGDVFSNDPSYPGFLCSDCRDPEDHPVDYAAFAYNGYFGDSPWMFDARLGIPFRIYNEDLQWVVAWFEMVFFESLTLLPDTLNIRLRMPNGSIVTVPVLQGGPDMPVGSPEPDPDPAPGHCSCGGGGDDGDDDWSDPDDYERPELEPLGGTVEIVDPDEYGEFPPWEEEL